MKKVLLTVAVMFAMAQAENVVHYDNNNNKKETTLSKPNHPVSNDTVKYDKAEKK